MEIRLAPRSIQDQAEERAAREDDFDALQATAAATAANRVTGGGGGGGSGLRELDAAAAAAARGPLLVVCFVCGRRTGLSSAAWHIRACTERFESRQV